MNNKFLCFEGFAIGTILLFSSQTWAQNHSPFKNLFSKNSNNNLEKHTCDEDFLRSVAQVLNENQSNNVEQLSAAQIEEFNIQNPKVIDASQMIVGNKPYIDMQIDDPESGKSTLRLSIAKDEGSSKIEIQESRTAGVWSPICSEKTLSKLNEVKAAAPQYGKRRARGKNIFNRKNKNIAKVERVNSLLEGSSHSKLTAYEKRDIELRESEDGPPRIHGVKIGSRGAKAGIIDTKAFSPGYSGDGGFFGAGYSRGFGNGTFTLGVGNSSFGERSDLESVPTGVMGFSFPFGK